MGRDHVLVTVAGRTTQRDDVARVGIGDRLEFRALAAVLGTRADPLDRLHRDGARVGEDFLAVVGQAEGRLPATIGQHQGGAGAGSPQRDRRATAGEAGAEGFRHRAGTVGGERLQVLGDRRLAGALDLLAGDDLHR
jgi:hypothetical protein